jgi:hypothetical protein
MFTISSHKNQISLILRKIKETLILNDRNFSRSNQFCLKIKIKDESIKASIRSFINFKLINKYEDHQYFPKIN